MLDIKIRNGLPFPVVGVGASADDPGALLEYFAGRPSDSGMIYIVTQPSVAEGEAQIRVTAEFLARHTRMPVSTMTDGMSLEPNHVYVMPPLIA
ncbi:MAG TPA: chemotaxis protein CheB [Steroidobacteraceae bacterium]|jgi:two-component system CheB/CheR fusion protein